MKEKKCRQCEEHIFIDHRFNGVVYVPMFFDLGGIEIDACEGCGQTLLSSDDLKDL